MRFRSTKWSLGFSTLAVLGFFVACSSSDPHPAPGGDADAAAIPIEGSVREGGEGGGDSGLCKSGKLDGTESDVDCGGTDGCDRCALGKKCEVPTDCEPGASCNNKQCAICDDKKTDGDETDVDCGGKACGGCTVGKRMQGRRGLPERVVHRRLVRVPEGHDDHLALHRRRVLHRSGRGQQGSVLQVHHRERAGEHPDGLLSDREPELHAARSVAAGQQPGFPSVQ